MKFRPPGCDSGMARIVYGERLEAPYRLARIPFAQSVRVYANGLRWTQGVDYTLLSGRIVVPTPGANAALLAEKGNVVVCDYEY